MKIMKKQAADKSGLFKQAFINRLKAARKGADFTQEVMAAKLGLERDTYSKYEYRTLLPMSLLKPSADILGVTTNHLLTGEPVSEAAHNAKLMRDCFEETLSYLKERKIPAPPKETADFAMALYEQFRKSGKPMNGETARMMLGMVVNG